MGHLKKFLLQNPEITYSKPSSPDLHQNQKLLTNEDINMQQSSPSFSLDTTSKVEIKDINFNSGYYSNISDMYQLYLSLL